MCDLSIRAAAHHRSPLHWPLRQTQSSKLRWRDCCRVFGRAEAVSGEVELGMPTISNKDIEAEARSLLRKQIQESAWYPWMKEADRRRRIEEDVDRYWYVKVSDTRSRNFRCDEVRVSREGCEPALLVGELVPGAADCLEHSPIVVQHTVREIPLAQVQPDTLHRVQLGRR
jgi:plasmid stability protein